MAKNTAAVAHIEVGLLQSLREGIKHPVQPSNGVCSRQLEFVMVTSIKIAAFEGIPIEVAPTVSFE